MKLNGVFLALSGVLLLMAVIIASFLSVILGVIVIVLAIIVIVALNFLGAQSNSDVVERLRSSPKRGFFDNQIEHLVKNYHAIQQWGSNAKEYDETSSITKSYNLIVSQMNNIMESAIKYIKTYDYISQPRSTYIVGLLDKSDTLVSKLHELQELILKVDDSTSDVDISYVDDMLEALRELGKQN